MTIPFNVDRNKLIVEQLLCLFPSILKDVISATEDGNIG